MQVRKTTNRDWNVGSLERDMAMDLCFLTLKTVPDQSGNKTTHFWPTKTSTNKTPGSSHPWMMYVVK
jgi:hypothetical protein